MRRRFWSRYAVVLDGSGKLGATELVFFSIPRDADGQGYATALKLCQTNIKQASRLPVSGEIRAVGVHINSLVSTFADNPGKLETLLNGATVFIKKESTEFELGNLYNLVFGSSPACSLGGLSGTTTRAESVKLDCPQAPIEIPPISISPEQPFNVYIKTESELTLHTTTHTLYLEVLIEVET